MRLINLYLFECRDGGRFAFSVDDTGSNLPRSLCRSGWRLRAHLKTGDLIEHDYAAAIDASAEHGFCVLDTIPAHWLD
ncbi:MAG TPA: hypothetical protein VKF35_13860 [Hyphomicrobiaceae bacterium]|nr:hypothetical protein [Hyphomicrobiaceae bacterium]